MFNIAELLLKTRNLILSKELEKETIRKIIFDLAGVTINHGELEIKNGIIYLKTKPIYKNEIFFKKDKIISEIKKNLNKNIENIF
jgi:hypothetical protein